MAVLSSDEDSAPGHPSKFVRSSVFVINEIHPQQTSLTPEEAFMEWKDLEKMTIVKLREEALKFPQIESVHGKGKEQLMDELAQIMGIRRPLNHFSETIIHTKSDLKHRIHELKAERDRVLAARDHARLHDVRREMHALKHQIRKIEAREARV
jgi:hypothetical protein